MDLLFSLSLWLFDGMVFDIFSKRQMLAEMKKIEEEDARNAVINAGRTITPVISASGDNLFDIHTEDISEQFGIMTDRKKDKKKPKEKEEEEEEMDDVEEFGVERKRKPARKFTIQQGKSYKLQCYAPVRSKGFHSCTYFMRLYQCTNRVTTACKLGNKQFVRNTE